MDALRFCLTTRQQSMQVQVLLTSAPSSAPASLAAKNAESTNDVEEGDWPRGDAEVLAFFRKVRLLELKYT